MIVKYHERFGPRKTGDEGCGSADASKASSIQGARLAHRVRTPQVAGHLDQVLPKAVEG